MQPPPRGPCLPCGWHAAAFLWRICTPTDIPVLLLGRHRRCCGFWCYPCLYGRNAAKIEQRDSCFVNCCLFWVLHYFCMQACECQVACRGPNVGALLA